jgi:hypothetical protein
MIVCRTSPQSIWETTGVSSLISTIHKVETVVAIRRLSGALVGSFGEDACFRLVIETTMELLLAPFLPRAVRTATQSMTARGRTHSQTAAPHAV